MNKHWLTESCAPPMFGYHNSPTMEGIFPAFLHRAIQRGSSFHDYYTNGEFTGNQENLLAQLKSLSFTPLVNYHRPLHSSPHQNLPRNPFEKPSAAKDTPYWFQKGPDTLAYLEILEDGNGINNLCFYCLTDDDTLPKMLDDCFKDCLIEESPHDGKVWSLCSSGHGLDMRLLGVAGKPLERDNYTVEVLHKFDLAVQDLLKPEPKGRLVVVEGTPGTGKTFLVRGLINATKQFRHYLLPPSMVQQLGSPEIVPVLMDLASNKREQGPAIFILEDADECLVPRQVDNISAISSMLNVTDGILGKLVDIRLVVTTNARKTQIDDALLRHGRLSQHIEVGPLSGREANNVYSRLIPGAAGNYSASVFRTLADVYYDAAVTLEKVDEVPPPVTKPERRMGFGR